MDIGCAISNREGKDDEVRELGCVAGFDSHVSTRVLGEFESHWAQHRAVGDVFTYNEVMSICSVPSPLQVQYIHGIGEDQKVHLAVTLR